MRIIILMAALCLLSNSIAQNTPLSINGRLKLVGKQLSNEYGNPVQLRGMSSHGLQWFGNCINGSSMDAMAYQWGCDIVRAAMYVQEGGYVTNPAGYRAKVDEMVDQAAARGMYCMIDWHILTPGNPWANINEAKEFFRIMAQKHAGKKHVLYEICNEPNNIDWPSVKGYAEQIIPIIRQYDSEAIIIVGTPTWSGEPHFAADNPITGSYAHNLMYTFHFYAGSHYNQNYINGLLSRIPLFVTEWGTSNASGNGGNDYTNAQRWIDLFAGQNSAGVKVSWCNWTFSDKGESSAALNQGACGSGQWNNTTASGTWVKNHILYPADDFRGGNNGTQSPYYGTAFNLPTTIQAEDYDKGGEGVAYHDADGVNSGGKYRNDAVDIESSTEGGYNIGWSAAGEWLEYSVNVANAGSYTLDCRVASAATGGTFHVEFNGTNATGTLTAPSTSGWQTWSTVSKTVSLSSGAQIMRVYFESGGFNLNSIAIRANDPIDNGIVSGAVYKLTARHTGKCMDVAGVSLANGAKIQQWDCDPPQSNQLWKVESTGDGHYKIISLNSGKVLDVSGFSTANGAVVHQWDYHGGDNQRWSFVDLGNGFYKIQSKLSGKVLDVAGISPDNGAAIHQWEYAGGNNQQWRAERMNGLRIADTEAQMSAAETMTVSPNPSTNGIYHIVLPANSGKEISSLLLNQLGETMNRASYNTRTIDLNLSQLNQGIYQLIVKDELGNTWTEKIIVQ